MLESESAANHTLPLSRIAVIPGGAYVVDQTVRHALSFNTLS